MILDVRKIRNDLGMSRVQFAKKLGCSEATVRNWEEGYNTPAERYVLKLQELDGTVLPDFISKGERKLLKTFHIANDFTRSGLLTTADILDIIYEYVPYEETEKILHKWATVGFYKYHDALSNGCIDWEALPKKYKKALKV